jgi:WXG100 family type VII secretion target
VRSLSGFEAESGQFQSAATHVRDVRDQVMGQIRALQGTVAELGASWRGAAASDFQALMQRWNDNAQALQEALSGIAEQVDASGVQYRNTDAEQAATMTRVMNALGG